MENPVRTWMVALLTWLVSGSVVKAVTMGASYWAVKEMGPKILDQISGFLGTGTLSSYFASLSPGVLWFMDMFAVSYGAPLVLAAFVSSFMARSMLTFGR